ncbi:MAG: tetratricopeptide repeat protein [Myxococcales bacterium]|nr:tetratricopeptide repeat protein [Myxococcales bacterium]
MASRKRHPREADELVRLFCARAEDARGEAAITSTERAAVVRIVDLLGRNRVAVLLAAGRAATESAHEIEADLRALATFDENEPRGRDAVAAAETARHHGDLRKAARLATSALAASAGDLSAKARAYATLGAIHRARGDLDAAHEARTLALASRRALGDRKGLAVALGELGTALASLGRLQEARSSHEAALALHRELGQRREEGVELSYLGASLHRAGRFEEAKRAHEMALAAHVETKNERLEGAERMHLAYVCHELGELDEARSRYRDALAILRRVGDRALVGVLLGYLGALEVEARRPEEAGALLAQARVLHREVKSPRHDAITRLHLAEHHLALGEPKAAASELERVLARDVLEPEHRAWAEALVGRPPTLTADFEDQKTREAINLLTAARSFDASSGAKVLARRALANLRASGPIVGRRVRFAAARLAEALTEDATPLAIAADAGHFIVAGRRTELGRRHTLKLVLRRLVEARLRAPGEPVPWGELLRAGWPDERILYEAGFIRVRNAMAQLRRAGLEPLLTARGGYLLDPSVPLVVEET